MNNLMITFENISNENENLISILKIKFVEISNILKECLKVASKGNRKDLLIFKPESCHIINKIEDKFVKYIVRSIYDNYKDIVNSCYHMHMNELFCNGVLESIFHEINPKLKDLHLQIESLNKNYYSNPEVHNLHRIESGNYKFYMKKHYTSNVFNPKNPLSSTFYVEYNKFLDRIKTKHKRVQIDKLDSFIDKHYDYSKEKDLICENFVKTIPEYMNIQNRLNEIRTLHNQQEKELKAKYDSELSGMDFKKYNKPLSKLIDQFTSIITNSIINGAI